MGKHSGGKGDTMKDSGDWQGNKGEKTERIETPKKDDVHKDVINDDEK